MKKRREEVYWVRANDDATRTHNTPSVSDFDSESTSLMRIPLKRIIVF